MFHLDMVKRREYQGSADGALRVRCNTISGATPPRIVASPSVSVRSKERPRDGVALHDICIVQC